MLMPVLGLVWGLVLVLVWCWCCLIETIIGVAGWIVVNRTE